MNSLCTQHVITGFQVPLPPVGVFRKYDKNFQETAVAHGELHHGWISHEAAITLINKQCTCGKSDSDDDFATVETALSSGEGLYVSEPVPMQVAPTFQVGWVTRRQFVKPLTCSFQMRLLPEEIPLPSSPRASAVRGCQRAVPSDPKVHWQMAKTLAARRKSIPYGGVAKQQQ